MRRKPCILPFYLTYRKMDFISFVLVIKSKTTALRLIQDITKNIHRNRDGYFCCLHKPVTFLSGILNCISLQKLQV